MSHKLVSLLCFVVLYCANITITDSVTFSKLGFRSSRYARVQLYDDEKILLYKPESELIVGVVMPMTKRLIRNSRCVVAETAGIQTLEALLYALDVVANKSKLPFTLGAIVLDTCYDAGQAMESTLKLVTPEVIDSRPTCSFECPDGSNAKPIQQKEAFWKVIGIIGSENTEESLQMTYLLEMNKVAQISHLATSTDFSNEQNYPSFMRTAPSDYYTAKAMVSVLLNFTWTYVSAIYDDTIYSIGGFYNFEMQAREAGICFATKDQLDSANPNYNKTMQSLLNTKQATVVVIFASFKVAGQLLRHACEYKYLDFVWLVTDTLTGRNAIDLGDCQIYTRMLAVVPRIQGLREFDERFKGYRPSKNVEYNPWMTEYYESHCNCKYRLSPEDYMVPNCESIEEQCANSLWMNYRQDPYLTFITETVFAYAEGVKLMYNKSGCPYPRDFSKELCSAMQPKNLSKRSQQLIDIMRGVSFLNLNNYTFRFHNRIDGPPHYSIVYYENTTDWLKAGDYCGESNTTGCTELSFSPSFRLFRLAYFRNISSRCSATCSYNQATKYLNKVSKCCWTCENCSMSTFVNRSLDGADDECLPCGIGAFPNEYRNSCLAYIDDSLTVAHPLWIASTCLSIFGLLLALAVSTVLLLYRKTPVIKASDVYSSGILLIGCVLAFVLPFLLNASPSPSICSATRFFLGVCVTLIYATIFAKSMRIMFIFNRGTKSELPRVFKHRLGVVYMVMILLGLELFVVALWIILVPPATSVLYDDANHTYENTCATLGLQYMLVFALPLLLSLPSVYFAFRIRKVPDGFNEGRSVSYLVYANGILIISFIPLLVSDVFSYKLNVFSLSLLIQLNGLVTLSLIFSTRLYIVLFRPEKNTREAVMNRSRAISAELSDNVRRRCSTSSYVDSSQLADSILHQVSPRRPKSSTDHRSRSSTQDSCQPDTPMNTVDGVSGYVDASRSRSKSLGDIYRFSAQVSRSRTSTAMQHRASCPHVEVENVRQRSNSDVQEQADSDSDDPVAPAAATAEASEPRVV